jgi:transposase
MKNFELTSSQIAELRFAHKTAKNKSDAYKINVVILLGTGWTLEEVANALLLDGETARKYAHLYQEGGLARLLETRHQGGWCRLSVEQLALLCNELDQKIHLKTDTLIEFIANEFSVLYTKSGITTLLHRLGYVYKKPKLIPGVPDEDIQEMFVEQYHNFMKTKPEDVAVFFMDATHPEHNAQAAYGWIKKGEDKKIVRHSKGKRVNLHGALNIETLDTIVIETEKVDSQSTIDLFKSMESFYPFATLIYVIMDNAGYHDSGEVMKYLKTSRIKPVLLPPRSPNLNLIERLWKLLKEKVVYNKYYEKYKDFRDACVGFFKNLKDYENELISLMSEEFQIISR